MPRNNLICDQCEKHIGDDKLAYFSDAEKDLDFCSEACYTEWNKWKEIHPDFTSELQQKWIKNGFTHNSVKEWIDIGLSTTDSSFVWWLRNAKKINAEWFLSHGNEQELRKEFSKSVNKLSDKINKIKESYPKISSDEQKENESIEAQEWLDLNYPQEGCISPYSFYSEKIKIKRSEVEEIYINEQLEGELDLIDFTRGYGVRVLISLQVDASKFEIKNQGGNVEIIKLINAQEWLDKNYPKNGVCRRETNDEKWDGKKYSKGWNNQGKTRAEITKLDIWNKNLEGNLDLSDFVNLKELDCSENKLTSLDVSNCPQLWKIVCFNNQLTNLIINGGANLTEISCPDNRLKEYWQDIHPWFDDWNKKEWEKQGLNKEQTKQWIEIGAEPKSYDFIIWLKNNKKVDLEWALNNQKEFKDLQERYKEYGLCEKCQQFNTNRQFCYPCSQQDFSQTTSSNKEVDEFIHQQQLKATDKGKSLAWIPYKEFTNIKHLADGGFGKVYKAQWDKSKGHDKTMALKSLNNSQNMTTEFCQEIANHNIFSGGFIVNCYGISQDPQTKNHLMVMQYMNDGNLREHLQNKYSELSFKDKIRKLIFIADGLKNIHEKGLVHRDFHSGNILNNRKYFTFITDLGLAKPANETDDSKVYGVMPYVAPEVLLEKPYTPASDVYSFGIVMYEMFSGLPPYLDRNHDVSLALDVCRGLRPQFQIKITQLLEDLINRCWSVEPLQRPTVKELSKILGDWWTEIRNKKDTEFTQQVQATETLNQTLSEEIRNPKYKLHEGAVYHSKLINTKEIVQLFQESEEKALEQEIKKIEKEVSQLLTNETKELVKEFLKTKKQSLKNREDKQAKKDTGKLKKQLLEEKILSGEKVNEIIRYCERFIESEKQLEKEQLKVNIEIPSNNK